MPHALKRRLLRIVTRGAAVALLAGAAGAALAWWRVGGSDAATLARVERDVRGSIEQRARSLAGIASAVAADPRVPAALRNENARAPLFEVLEQRAQEQRAEDLAITVYGGGAAVAWVGRPSEIPPERIGGPTSLFVAPGALGLRLVHVERVVDPRSLETDATRRAATVAAERVLSPASGVRDPASYGYTLDTFVGPVSLRPRYEGAGDRPRPFTFVVHATSGDALVEVSVPAGLLGGARRRALSAVAALALGALALTALFATGPLLDWRSLAPGRTAYLRATSAIVATLLAARALLWFVTPLGATIDAPPGGAGAPLGALLPTPASFLLSVLLVLALVALGTDGVRRWRLDSRRWRRPHGSTMADVLRAGALHAAAVGVSVMILALFERLLLHVVERASADVGHFSLHPWNASRLAIVLALTLAHVAAVWTAVLVLVAARLPWRGRPAPLYLHAVWWAPSVAVLALAAAVPAAVPMGYVAAVAALCAVAALWARQATAWHRHASRAAQLLATFLALFVPALLAYPSFLYATDRDQQRLITTEFAPQAAGYPQELQARLERALVEIDDMPGLPGLVQSLQPEEAAAPQTDAAFLIWRRTELAEFRLASAVELYDAGGALVSRFALNLPEYAAATPRVHAKSCTWDLFGESVPFGATERRMLHAERGICADGSDPRAAPQYGSIVVHAMLDYGTLPLITSQNPYYELFRSSRSASREGMRAADVELVIYGWGRLPFYVSGRGAWPLDDALFARIYRSREPFWTDVQRGDERCRVYFSNNRAGIYAVGYPLHGPFDHLVHLAEMTTLVALASVGFLVGATVFSRVARRSVRYGRDLLREVRASFYRKLAMAFILAAVLPVLTLALVIRAYFAAQLGEDVEAEAARTAEVAQRVVEDTFALQQQAEQGFATLNDDLMLLISRIIDQDVNIFDGPRLVATSERDLFASGLLPTRTPDDVYRAIALERLPAFVGEDVIGGFRYMIAATPVRAAGLDAILTVPLGLQQQDIEREIDDLDRGVLLAALLFVLAGAALGMSMAERIGDPVRRLTRATQRLARGDFDARVAVRSADELQRLVDAFNSMAAELKTQRGQLERTHRLEAWAEMARQVAHDIKNPLTPIQLSAEHLMRVHTDRGAPLAPVLETSVAAILSQVRLLRQIAAEFSSFASAPTARPVRTAPAELVREVIEPYLAGATARVAIDLDVERPLPDVHVDRTLVARALTNVVENALHAMPGGGRLSITADALDGRVRIVVSDTGVGMEEEARARIFEPYFSTRATGTGLGLTIAKRNIELNGGSIDVQSERGKGTAVTITLPAADSSTA
jgi:signal transduction histidine kinase